LIDEKIGEIINLLRKKGMLENTVFIFTSDHGDNLGDHKLPYKWLMYDTITRVPLLIRDFRRASNTVRIEDLVSLIDLGPTILEIAGSKIPTYIEGKSLVDYLETGKSENPSQYIFAEDNYLVMIRSQEYKLVYYIDQPYGELYDLQRDPWELENLWDVEAYQAVKVKFKEDFLDWISRSNYFNAGYKQTRSKDYEMIWPENDDFSLIAQYSHLSISQKAFP
jgi:arylsulfatase A-like enzyme